MMTLPDMVKLQKAILLKQSFEQAGVADTPEARAAWKTLDAEMAAMAQAGIVPDIPFDA